MHEVEILGVPTELTFQSSVLARFAGIPLEGGIEGGCN